MALNFDEYFDIILSCEQEIVDRMAEVTASEIEKTSPSRFHDVMLETVEQARQLERTKANLRARFDKATNTFDLKLDIPVGTPPHVETIFEVIDDSNRHRGDGKGTPGLYTHPGEETYTENLEEGETHHSPERYKQRHMKGWERDGYELKRNIDTRLSYDPVISAIGDRLKSRLLQYVTEHL